MYKLSNLLLSIFTQSRDEVLRFLLSCTESYCTRWKLETFYVYTYCFVLLSVQI